MFDCKSCILIFLALLCPTATVIGGPGSSTPGADSPSDSSLNWFRALPADRTPALSQRPERESPDCPASIAAIEEDEDTPDDSIEAAGRFSISGFRSTAIRPRSFDAPAPAAWESRRRSISLRC